MGFKENFKNFFTPADDEAYEDENQSAELDYEYEEKSRKSSKQEQSSKPSNITGMSRAAQLQVVLVKPETFEDGLGIAPAVP